MCGIVGYLGKKAAVPLLVDSLKQLEYRGYDSAGIAVMTPEQEIEVYKAPGKLLNLENLLAQQSTPYQTKQAGDGALLEEDLNLFDTGIGHIRWATHGKATQENAHPHTSHQGNIALVHNGIIENFAQIRQMLEEEGVVFQSDTDTECVAHLLEYHYDPNEDFCKVIRKTCQALKGTYALTIMNRNNPNTLYAVRNHAPLIVGVMEDGSHMVASDTVAVVQHTNRVIYLNDLEIVEITPNSLRLIDMHGRRLTPQIVTIQSDALTVDKRGYKHFMLKEIHEQPDVVRNSLAGRLTAAEEPVQFFESDDTRQIKLSGLLKNTKRLLVIGCGSSFNVGQLGKYFIEEVAQIPVDIESAGECRYRNLLIDDSTLVVAISQSGETADTLEALRQCKAKGCTVVAVTNREDSSIARESEVVLPVHAGVEISVCATKSFVAQMVVLMLLGLSMAEAHTSANRDTLHLLKSDLLKMPARIETVLANPEPIEAVAKQHLHARDLIYIGRGINFPIAMEGALKLKEITYQHAEGYSGSELKHGPIALLDKAVPVLAVLVPGAVYDKILSNCLEAKARDAQLIGVTSVRDDAQLEESFDALLRIPPCHELLSPLLAIVPLQLFAYYIAAHLGRDVDQPRNLAKSVTVE